MSCYVVRGEEAKKLKPSVLFGRVSKKAHISHAIDSPLSKHMRAGFLRLDPGYSKDLESPLDEIDLFMEGSLTVTFEGKSFTAHEGDILFIERGTKAHFDTKDGCFVFYVTYPLMQDAMDDVAKKLKEKKE